MFSSRHPSGLFVTRSTPRKEILDLCLKYAKSRDAKGRRTIDGWLVRVFDIVTHAIFICESDGRATLMNAMRKEVGTDTMGMTIASSYAKSIT